MFERTQDRRVPGLAAVGIILSALLVWPSLRQAPINSFTIVFHAVLFTVLSSPFIITYLIARGWPSGASAVIFMSLYAACHAVLIYLTYSTRPREFGSFGLLFAPLFESVVAVPLGIVMILMSKGGRPRRVG